MAKNEALSINI